MNYQGKITDAAGTPLTGTSNITFSLYDVATGGTSLWTETQPANLANGIFSVTLGFVAALPAEVCSGDSLYLGITVEGDAEMTPRQRITSNGYAFKAGTAEAVSAGAVDTQGIADGAVTDAKITSLDASKLTGTVSDSALPANAAKLDASQTFSGTQTGSFSGTFTGDGSGLTSLPAGSLPANVDLLDSAQTITGVKAFNPSSGTVPFTVDASKTAVVTNLNADTVDGQHASAFAPATGSGNYVAKTGDGMTGTLTCGITSGTGRAGYFLISNTGNSSDALYATTNGSGNAGYFQASGSGHGVFGRSFGAGYGVYGVSSGTGKAGSFEIQYSDNTNDALYATTIGTGYALKAESSNAAPKAASLTGQVDVTGAVNVTGVVTATSFSGDGAGLTNIAPASASVTSSSILDGTIGTADIADGSITGMDIASGAITNSHISASAAIADTKLATISTAGKVSDSALSSNVALLTGTQTFTGAKTFSNNLTMNAPVTVNAALSATAFYAPLLAPSSGATGQPLSVQATAGSNAVGGNLTLSSGTTSVWAFPANAFSKVTVKGGNCDAGSASGAVVEVEGGKNSSYTNNFASGGNVVITGGTAVGSYAGGNIVLLPGSGTPAGNVGIGTSNPSATLDVTGTVKATSFSGSGSGLTGVAKPHTGAVYRWAEFDTYDNAGNWMLANDPNMFGGVQPSTWTDNFGLASQMSADKEVLRTLFTRKGYGGKNAIVNSKMHSQYSSTTGHVTLALFRIKNTTGSDIIWTPFFYYTAYYAWGETASVALNGVSRWTSGSGTSAPGGSTVSFNLMIPANRTSTVIFVSPSGNVTSTGGLYVRPNILAFFNNSLLLPAGLEYADDLDTATGGWEQ